MIWTGTTRGGHDLTIDCRDGTSDRNIANLIISRDEYRLDGLEFRGVAIDIGAHIGCVTIPLLLDNADLHVVAIEPVADNATALRKNLAANRVYRRATVLPVAAGIDGVVPILYGWKGRHAFIGNLDDGSEPKFGEEIVSMSFSEIRKGVGLEMVGLVKLDCEGCEWDVLADPDIWRAEMIVGEFHHQPMSEGHERISDLLGDTHRVEFFDWTFRAVLK